MKLISLYKPGAFHFHVCWREGSNIESKDPSTSGGSWTRNSSPSSTCSFPQGGEVDESRRCQRISSSSSLPPPATWTDKKYHKCHTFNPLNHSSPVAGVCQSQSLYPRSEHLPTARAAQGEARAAVERALSSSGLRKKIKACTAGGGGSGKLGPAFSLHKISVVSVVVSFMWEQNVIELR